MREEVSVRFAVQAKRRAIINLGRVFMLDEVSKIAVTSVQCGLCVATVTFYSQYLYRAQQHDALP